MITLKDLPQNLLDGYVSSFDSFPRIDSGVPAISLDVELDPTRGHYCHYRIVGHDSNYFYKLFNFNRSSLPTFLSSVKYDIGFNQAVSDNFYSGVSPVKDYIYDDSNKAYVGYILPKMKQLSSFDTVKFSNLMNRLRKKIKKHSLAHTDVHINNIMELKGVYYLIDLETITPLSVFRDKEVRKKYFTENLKAYEDMVLSI
jgi:hypothetical protein